MAGLPWFELDTDFHDSPKVRALCARLREPLADAYVARLYAYCYRHARDRYEAETAEEVIEEAARWRGKRGGLLGAFLVVGLAGLAFSIHGLGHLYFQEVSTWPKVLMALGAAIFFVALYRELRRTHGNTIDDVVSQTRL